VLPSFGFPACCRVFLIFHKA
jgi:hypothetical protein